MITNNDFKSYHANYAQTQKVEKISLKGNTCVWIDIYSPVLIERKDLTQFC